MTWTHPRLTSLVGVLFLSLLGCSSEGDDDSAIDDDDAADDDATDDDDDTGDDDDSSEPGAPPCASGDWGAITDPDNSVHVRVDGSDEDGDGTAANPLATMQAALDVTREREDHKRIAVGPGVFETFLAIQLDPEDADPDNTDSGLSIEGCSEDETILVPLDQAAPVVFVHQATDVRLSGFTIDGGRRALLIWDGASVDLDFVAVKNSARIGILFGGWETIVAASHLTVEDTQLEIDDYGVEYGYGIAIQEATVELTDSSVSGSHRVGILVDGAPASLERVLVDGTQPGTDGSLGRGIQIQNVSNAQLIDLDIGSITPNSDAGLFSQSTLWLQVENTRVYSTAAADFEVGGTPCSGEACPGDGIVVNQGGEGNDPAVYSNYLYDNVVDGAVRAGIVVESVVADVDGNQTTGCGVTDDLTGESIFVQGDVETDAGDPVITGADDVAERAEAFPLNHAIIEIDGMAD